MENHCKYSELPSDAMVSSVPLLKLVILLNDTSLCKCIYLVMVVRLCSTAGFILRVSGLLVSITCGCLCCQGKLPLSIYSSSFRRCWGSTRPIVVWCSTSIRSQSNVKPQLGWWSQNLHRGGGFLFWGLKTLNSLKIALCVEAPSTY